jgi:hypothetical protein
VGSSVPERDNGGNRIDLAWQRLFPKLFEATA